VRIQRGGGSWILLDALLHFREGSAGSRLKNVILGANPCSKSLLMKDLFLFYVVMLTPAMPHIRFFQFSDTCNLGLNGSTIF
jgi:hypothetical protein